MTRPEVTQVHRAHAVYSRLSSPVDLTDEVVKYIATGEVPGGKDTFVWPTAFHGYAADAEKLAYYEEYMTLKEVQRVTKELEPNDA